MSKKKKIAIIGHFGGNQELYDGQTIKTKILYSELKKATEWDIKKIDTYYKDKNKIKLLKDTFLCLLSIKDIVVLLSQNGMKFYFPILYFFCKVFHVRVYHDVIGGNLDTYVDKYPKYKKYLNTFEVNWVETEGLKKRLQQKGITNCEVMPNFKRLPIINEIKTDTTEPFRFCMFSRVMKEKGIEIAIEAIEKINADNQRNICELDIYGNIDDAYKENFENIMKNVSDAIRYKGCVPFDKSVETIKDYYALLFPTYWMGEGFPGTIIDAFSAGIPVIASDWNCNNEIIENNKNGILYPNDDIKNLEEAIKSLIINVDKIEILKQKCAESAKIYLPDIYIERIYNTITKREKG